MRLLTVSALAAVVPVSFALPASAATPGGAALSNLALVRPVAYVPAPPRSGPAPAKHARLAGAAGPQTYLIYDSTMPWQLPSNRDVAVYANGRYQASFAAVAHSKSVLWIDVTGSNTGCDALDVEPGDASPATAGTWAKARLSATAGSIAVIYTMRAEWQATRQAISKLPAQLRDRVRWWIADPTGKPHIVPGSDATQWYWGSTYDISTAANGF
jgi:hypothetical protein